MPTWLRWALGLAPIAILLHQLALRWEDVRGSVLAPAPAWLVAALAALIAGNLMVCEAWRRWLGALGDRPAFREAYWILFTANVAKYLPGSVWQFVGRVVLAERRGIAPARTAIAIAMESGCAVASALLVGLLVVWTLPGAAPPARGLAMGLGALGIVALMHPTPLNAALAAAGRLTGRDLPRVPFGYGRILAMLAWYAGAWVVSGASMALLGAGLHAGPLGEAQVLALAAGYAAAWALGALAAFAPAGLGVREAAYALVLAQAFPAAWAIAFALAARLLVVVAELAIVGAALALGPGPSRVRG